MALPEHLLLHKDSDRLFSKVGLMMDQYAEARTGVAFDLDAWEASLAPLDYHLAILSHFLGTWENSGSFVCEAGNWSDQEARVTSALSAFACGKTANLFRAAAELNRQIVMRFDSDQDITPEQATLREQMNQAANDDVSYEKLAAFIREHHADFLQ